MAEQVVENDFNLMSDEEKKQELFKRQMQILDSFLERNAISQDEYDKSLNGLKEKMGIGLNEK